MQSLWDLLLSAQASPGGVPQQFIDEKKEELRALNIQDQRVMGEVRRRQDGDAAKTVMLDEIRQRERMERRGPGGGQGGYGRGRGGGGGDGRGYNGSGRGRDSGWGNRGGRPSGPDRDDFDRVSTLETYNYISLLTSS